MARQQNWNVRGIRNIFPRRDDRRNLETAKRRTFYHGLSCHESISVRKWRGGNFRAREVLPVRKTFAREFIPLKWRFALQKAISQPRGREIAAEHRSCDQIHRSYEGFLFFFKLILRRDSYSKKNSILLRTTVSS